MFRGKPSQKHRNLQIHLTIFARSLFGEFDIAPACQPAPIVKDVPPATSKNLVRNNVNYYTVNQCPPETD